MENNTPLTKFAFPVALVVLAFTARFFILGNATAIKLNSAPALAGQISQSLGPNSQDSLPNAGKDYNFTPKYFDNNNWVVISIKPINNNINSSVLVMERKNNYYQTVLGPGSAFTTNQTASLPGDVAAYVSTQGATYKPGVE